MLNVQCSTMIPMDFQVPIQIPNLPTPVNYKEKLLLVGSCFTEHIGNKLEELKFSVLQNPNGILFDPASIAASLVSYIQNKRYTEQDLFFLNELWQSWQHHSRFSGTDKNQVLENINQSQQRAHEFLKTADWLIITPGTSYSYRLTGNYSPSTGGGQGEAVANCHRAPAAWFDKHLMSIEEINSVLDNCIHQLFQFNSKLRIIFTVSPVRHIRDGVINNNRSKARLIEVVHNLVNKFDRLYYFPAYELVIDVLRDYRFYDADLVHPNYQGTQFVLEKFMQHCVDESSRALAEDIQKLAIARRHKAFQPDTDAHKKFLQSHMEKAKTLQSQHPYLDLKQEIEYFSGGSPAR
jgi:hypothetical protein